MIQSLLPRVAPTRIERTYFNLERAFFAAFGAAVYALRLGSIVEFFSMRRVSASGAYVDVNKRVLRITKVNRHCSSSLLALRNRKRLQTCKGFTPQPRSGRK